MKKIIIFLILLLLPLSLWAMTPLTDSDLCNVNNPLSLSINPDQIKDINNGIIDLDDPGDISKFLLFAINLTSRLDILSLKDPGGTTEVHGTFERFSFFFVSWGNNDGYISIQNYLNDPISQKHTTTISSAVDAHDLYSISDIPVETSHFMAYPKGLTTSSGNRPVIVELRPDGQTLLRSYYTNHTSSSILPKSWVDIKVR